MSLVSLFSVGFILPCPKWKNQPVVRFSLSFLVTSMVWCLGNVLRTSSNILIISHLVQVLDNVLVVTNDGFENQLSEKLSPSIRVLFRSTFHGYLLSFYWKSCKRDLQSLFTTSTATRMLSMRTSAKSSLAKAYCHLQDFCATSAIFIWVFLSSFIENHLLHDYYSILIYETELPVFVTGEK